MLTKSSSSTQHFHLSTQLSKNIQILINHSISLQYNKKVLKNLIRQTPSLKSNNPNMKMKQMQRITVIKFNQIIQHHKQKFLSKVKPILLNNSFKINNSYKSSNSLPNKPCNLNAEEINRKNKNFSLYKNKSL